MDKIKEISESSKVRHYLLIVFVEGMRKHLCFGCRMSKLYDKNNKEYKVDNRYSTLSEAMAIVEEIKKVNESD